MSTPNIFRYATSELSQDAFICWLVACASEATGHLKECGLAFVRALFRAGASDENAGIPVVDPDDRSIVLHDGPCDVSEVCIPRRQYLKIDVYFQARVDGKKVSFILEDKTDSEPHGNQLKRYLKDVINDEREEDLIKPIYFKTGYVFNNERDVVEENKYFLFKAKDLKKFLVGHPDAIRGNQILRQYAEYLDNLITERCKAQSEWCLNYAHVQWEFMRKLRKVLRNADGEWQHFVPDKFSREPDYREPDEWRWKGLGRWKNRGGSAWTQYWFSQHLYWRLDAWRPLRLMISFENAGMNYDQDLEEIQEYRRLFDQALEKEGLYVGNFRRVRAMKECTIGSIDTVNLQGMNVGEFLNRVNRVHIRFLESISQI